MAKFATNWTFRNPLRTIEFRAGQETVDDEVIAKAEADGALVTEEEAANGDGNDNRPATRGKARGAINLKG